MANVNEELGVHKKRKTPGNIISVKKRKGTFENSKETSNNRRKMYKTKTKNSMNIKKLKDKNE